MLYFVIKCALSGIIIAAVSEIAKRSPAFAALIVSLPLLSLLSFLWLWHDTGDAERIASVAESTFWYVLPSLPLFLILPALLRAGVGFWPSLAAGCAVTIALYFLTAWTLAKFGIRL
ncbi:DUF3147 family protein [Bradyrhizobium retamae]|uniref:Peptide ABC transporter permease n=1 Tax=Bradyrhizobium retamae TaxID=1300035 RepID=A0A0R3NHJ5_9BRAD|nr:DUF3147 family protein [Bradyrhizobium retamae]KRR29491.1 peptide ABC transporter permease [Bradyrhizobium retamae]